MPRSTRGPGWGWGRPALLLLVLLGGLGLAWGLGFEDALRLEQLASLERWVAGYGPWGPLLCIPGYVVLEMAFMLMKFKEPRVQAAADGHAALLHEDKRNTWR